MSDPYSILGVSKSASAADIKSAFRQLAKKNHPDQNPGDPKAKERFARINNAYDILGDADKRKQFDRGEIDSDGNPQHPGFGGFGQGGGNPFGGGFGHRGGRAFGGDADDILSEILGGLGGGQRQTTGGFGGFKQAQRPGKGTNLEAPLTVTLEQIAAGDKPSVTLPDGRKLAVTLPKPAEHGQIIRLKGQGGSGAHGGPKGDALITLKFATHPNFRADGTHLRHDAYVPLHDAYLGAKITVPTLTGKVKLTVPPLSSSGKTLRIPGKGLPGKTKAGDLLVTLHIAMPDTVDPALEALFKTQAQNAGS